MSKVLRINFECLVVHCSGLSWISPRHLLAGIQWHSGLVSSLGSDSSVELPHLLRCNRENFILASWEVPLLLFYLFLKIWTEMTDLKTDR